MFASYQGCYTFSMCHTEPLLLITVTKHVGCQAVPRHKDTSHDANAHDLFQRVCEWLLSMKKSPFQNLLMLANGGYE
jgi:hypothetical protein